MTIFFFSICIAFSYLQELLCSTLLQKCISLHSKATKIIKGTIAKRQNDKIQLRKHIIHITILTSNPIIKIFSILRRIPISISRQQEDDSPLIILIILNRIFADVGQVDEVLLFFQELL